MNETPEKIICPRCDNEVTALESVEGGNNEVCNTCIDNDYKTCYDCGNYYLACETIYEGGYDYCSTCHEDNFTQCSNCGNYTPNDDTVSVANGDQVCNACDEAYYTTCTYCDEAYNSDDTIYCDSCDYYYCESCSRDSDIHDCHNASSQVDISKVYCDTKGKTIKIKRLIGVELEAENGSRRDIILPQEFGITDDGSLSDDGVEVQTPPRELADFESTIKLACGALTNAGYSVNSSCGLHVHLDATDFKNDHDKIVNIFKTFYAIEPIIYSSLPVSRRSNSYCKPLKNDYTFFDVNKKLNSRHIERKIYKRNEDYQVADAKRDHYESIRYHGLNLHSIFFRGTVEFRYHSGSLNAEKITNWVNFLLHATDYAINRYKGEQITALMKTTSRKKRFQKMIKLFKINRPLEKFLMLRINQNTPQYFTEVEQDKEENNESLDPIVMF